MIVLGGLPRDGRDARGGQNGADVHIVQAGGGLGLAPTAVLVLAPGSPIACATAATYRSVAIFVHYFRIYNFVARSQVFSCDARRGEEGRVLKEDGGERKKVRKEVNNKITHHWSPTTDSFCVDSFRNFQILFDKAKFVSKNEELEFIVDQGTSRNTTTSAQG